MAALLFLIRMFYTTPVSYHITSRLNLFSFLGILEMYAKGPSLTNSGFLFRHVVALLIQGCPSGLMRMFGTT